MANLMNFDHILDKIGSFGRYQKIHWMTLYLGIIPSGTQNLLNIYLLAVPDHWCLVPELANLSQSVQRRFTAPPSTTDNNAYDHSCFIPDVNYTEVYTEFQRNSNLTVNVSGTRECDQWEYDYSVYGTTGVTKWDLVCSKAPLPAMAQSLYMLGFLMGAFLLGYVSDRFGRKISLFASIVGVVVFALLSCGQQNFWAHAVLRMLAGVAACGCITIPFVLVMEMTGPRNRLIPGLFAQVFFALGYIVLALVAYFARSFLVTNVVMSALPIVLFCYWWTESESPRWLLTHGRVEEAKVILKKMAKVNRVNVDVDVLLQEYREQQTDLLADKTKSSEDKSKHYTVIDIFRTPNMRKKSANVLFNWFVTSMTYYGLSMGVTGLGGDPYLNLFISGATECGSVIVMCFVLDRFGRRLCLAVVLIVGGLACLTYSILPPEYQIISIVLAMIGKFGVSGSFAIIYIFSGELFPTVVRTIGVGAGSMSARLGGLVAPFVAELKIFWQPLPIVIFGLFALLAGVLSFLLPETLGQKLPETLEEGEQFGKDLKILECYLPWRKPQNISSEDDKNDKNEASLDI